MHVCYLDIGLGDELRIGNGTIITLEKKTGQRAKIKVKSEYSIRMERGANEAPPAAGATAQTIRRPQPA
jgi:hypothetical protein